LQFKWSQTVSQFHPQKWFTLVELFVFVAAAAIVLSILVPTISVARANVRPILAQSSRVQASGQMAESRNRVHPAQTASLPF
jgi:hypothetical protein